MKEINDRDREIVEYLRSLPENQRTEVLLWIAEQVLFTELWPGDEAHRLLVNFVPVTMLIGKGEIMEKMITAVHAAIGEQMRKKFGEPDFQSAMRRDGTPNKSRRTR